VPAHEHLPTPSQRVRMRWKAHFTIHWDDHPDSFFFDYNPIGCSDDEDDPSLPRIFLYFIYLSLLVVVD